MRLPVILRPGEEALRRIPNECSGRGCCCRYPYPQSIDQLKDTNPEAYDQFVKIAHTLENHYRDMQDMEFTIERGKLFMLQTRNGKRTAQAALKIAVDLVSEGMITKEEAILKVDPKQLDSLLHPNFEAKH